MLRSTRASPLLRGRKGGLGWLPIPTPRNEDGITEPRGQGLPASKELRPGRSWGNESSWRRPGPCWRTALPGQGQAGSGLFPARAPLLPWLDAPAGPKRRGAGVRSCLANRQGPVPASLGGSRALSGLCAARTPPRRGSGRQSLRLMKWQGHNTGLLFGSGPRASRGCSAKGARGPERTKAPGARFLCKLPHQ